MAIPSQRGITRVPTTCAATPIEPGEMTVSASLHVTYEID